MSRLSSAPLLFNFPEDEYLLAGMGHTGQEIETLFLTQVDKISRMTNKAKDLRNIRQMNCPIFKQSSLILSVFERLNRCILDSLFFLFFVKEHPQICWLVL